jgi:phytoene dehydrogenase-like protein
MSKHYDVVVLGAGIGALSAAALLARRSWRVLVLGQGTRPPFYSYDGYTLGRRTFTLLANASPAWGRVLVELAQSQTFKRRTLPLDPMLQVLQPSRRLDLPPDTELFAHEIDREFPEVRRVVDELYHELARTNAAADAAFERDVVWPPGSFWERRETMRVAGTIPYLRGSPPPVPAGHGRSDDGEGEGAASPGPSAGRDFLAEFPRDHDYRTLVEVPARFATDLATELPAFALARLHGAWTRGVVRLARGEAELDEFLLERVRAHGGEARMSERATHVIARHGHVSGIRVEGEEEITGVQFIVTDLPTRALLDLAPDYKVSRRALEALPRIVAADQRFVVTLAVKDEGIPAPLATESFLLPAPSRRRPPVHLQCLKGGTHVPGTTLLVAEALLGEQTPLDPAEAREGVLETVEQFLPFVERHYVLVDSPHDGRPLWDFRSGRRVQVDRAQLRGWGASLEAEAMIPRWRIEPRTLAGLGGEPIRMPLPGAFAVGRTTLPALGQEGELLAAWGAARLITRTDRRKEKMRREMWSKVELG